MIDIVLFLLTSENKILIWLIDELYIEWQDISMQPHNILLSGYGVSDDQGFIVKSVM